jgi:neutral amino acid transport system ATP-binding protein
MSTAPQPVEAEAAPRSEEPALRVTDLVSGYVEEPVLRGVSIEVPRDTVVTVIGPNGSGKSTLLKTIVGLLRGREGSVLMLDRDGVAKELVGKRPHQVAEMGLAFVPQLSNVFTDLSIKENLEIGGFPVRGGEGERMDRVLGHFPILRERLSQRAGTLSGGQRQMLALGRALMSDPHVLVLDEPSAGLAPTVVDEVFERIRSINATGITVLIVEQKARQCLAISDYGYVLDMGRNRYEGPGKKLLHDPEVVNLYLGSRGQLGRSRRAAAKKAAESVTAEPGVGVPDTPGDAPVEVVKSTEESDGLG